MARQNSNFGPDEKGFREELFLPRVDEGTRTAYAPLWCKFDPNDRLVSCEANLGRRHIQRVTDEMVAGLKIGDSVVRVEARFCLAEARVFLPDGGVRLEYSIPRPGSRHSLANVYLRFDANGRLEAREVREH